MIEMMAAPLGPGTPSSSPRSAPELSCTGDGGPGAAGAARGIVGSSGAHGGPREETAMSESTPIGRTDDPQAYETARRSADDDDVDAGFGGAAADSGPDDPDIDGEELRSSSDDDRRAGSGRSAGDQDDEDVAESDDITERLLEGR
jgi:hypothetical protein